MPAEWQQSTAFNSCPAAAAAAAQSWWQTKSHGGGRAAVAGLTCRQLPPKLLPLLMNVYQGLQLRTPVKQARRGNRTATRSWNRKCTTSLDPAGAANRMPPAAQSCLHLSSALRWWPSRTPCCACQPETSTSPAPSECTPGATPEQRGVAVSQHPVQHPGNGVRQRGGEDHEEL